MKITIIIRELPIPIYAGLNLIIHNVIKILNKDHQVNVIVLDKECSPKKIDFPVKFESAHNSFKTTLNTNSSFKTDRIARYYRSEGGKLLWLQDRIRTYKPDVILGFGYDLLGYFGMLKTNIPKILDIVDSEVLYLWREIKQGNIRISNLKHLVASILIARKYVRGCDALITVSKEDTDNIRKLCRYGKIYTIPNGVDLDYYHPDESIKKINGRIIFTGSLNWPPNQQAILWFLNNCWKDILNKKPDASLTIIGKLPPKDLILKFKLFENIEFLGFVDDIRNFIRSAQVSIAPMVSGSGIKNKILEAWALGQPVVATYHGVKGLICENEKNILLADSAAQFSAQVIRLLETEKLREKIGNEGRKCVVKNYSWEKMGIEFNKLLNFFQKC